MEPTPKFCSSAVSFLQTFCVHPPVGHRMITGRVPDD
jgi:hypothetical protein